MYAIVDIAGQQYRVEKNQKVFVHRLDAEEGSSVDFDKVLLVDNDGSVKVGAPTVTNTIVSAKIVNHLKGDKVKIFKKKRRKGYKVLNGHRQYMTELLIEDIKAGKAAKKVEAKEEKVAAPAEKPKKVAAPKAEVKAKAAPKTETEAKPKAKAAPKAKTEAKPKAKAATKVKEADADKPKKKAAPKAEKPKVEPKAKSSDKESNDKADK